MKLERIHQLAMFSHDLDETIAFYRDKLGARFVARFDPPGLLFFDIAGTRLLFEKSAAKATVYFRVEDIETAYRELLGQGVVFVDQPHAIFKDEQGTFGEAGEEEWMVFFHDPSENLLALASRKRT
ncbi:MAG TPA: VOC family protein [Pyrinomonadaceae bacterium]|nr:VOC family protein [Pyrinomonadaceae bacterium]